MMQPDEELRLECLRLAHQTYSGDDARVIRLARAYADFALGTKDGEIVEAARTFAGKVSDAA